MNKQLDETINNDIDYISMLADTSFLDFNLDSKKCDIDYISMLTDTGFLKALKE